MLPVAFIKEMVVSVVIFDVFVCFFPFGLLNGKRQEYIWILSYSSANLSANKTQRHIKVSECAMLRN